MNLPIVLFLLILLALGVWGSQKLMKESADKEKSDEDRKILKVFAWIIRGVMIFFLIITLDQSGIIDVPNPFDGPKVGNSIPTTGYQPSEAVAPQVEAVDGRPNMDKVREEHQQQLDGFEEKKDE